jgi:hypothetical protein
LEYQGKEELEEQPHYRQVLKLLSARVISLWMVWYGMVSRSAFFWLGLEKGGKSDVDETDGLEPPGG